MPGRAIKFPTGPSNSRLYGGNVKSNALGLPGGGGGGGLIAVGFDLYIKKLFGTGLPIKACVLVLVHGTESAMFFPILEKYSLHAKDIFLVSFISWPSFIIFVGKLCPLGFKVISCLIPFQVFLIFLLLAVK
jgi:hypothetical protein